MVVQLLVDRPRVVLVDDCKNAKSKVVVLQTCFMAKHTYLANGDQQGHAHLQGVVRRGGCSGWRVVRPVCVLFASCLIALSALCLTKCVGTSALGGLCVPHVHVHTVAMNRAAPLARLKPALLTLTLRITLVSAVSRFLFARAGWRSQWRRR